MMVKWTHVYNSLTENRLTRQRSGSVADSLETTFKLQTMESDLQAARAEAYRLRHVIIPHAFCPICGEHIGDQEIAIGGDDGETLVHEICNKD